MSEGITMKQVFGVIAATAATLKAAGQQEDAEKFVGLFIRAANVNPYNTIPPTAEVIKTTIKMERMAREYIAMLMEMMSNAEK